MLAIIMVLCYNMLGVLCCTVWNAGAHGTCPNLYTGCEIMNDAQKQLKTQLAQKKRVRAQQGVISVFSMLCLLFSCVWGVHALGSKTAFFAPSSDDSSSAVKAEAKKKTSKSSDSKSDSKADSKDQSESKADTDDGDDLSDAAFIGDSRTVGLENTCPYPKATFFCYVGMHIDNAVSDPAFTLSNGNAGTVIDALSEGSYGRIYINLGTNELGWPYIENFQDYYRDLIQQIQAVQPEATVYAESILPVTAARELEGDDITNANVVRFNEAIQQVCTETGAVYLNCWEALADDSGCLPEDWSVDGIHLLGEACDKWLDYIIENT